MIDKTMVGKRIYSLRKNLGYSQAIFAEILNVSTQAVSKWETGLTLPDIEVLLNISWICKTSINSILEGDDFIEYNTDIDRGLLRLNSLLICPKCQKSLKLNKAEEADLSFECENEHRYHIVDGVVDFRTREVKGEQWSLSFRNYDEYLTEHHCQGNPNYDRGLNADEIIWTQINQLRPKILLDIACGTGQGIKHQIKRINWPITIIMTDISHRILKWDKLFYSNEWKNPYVEMVYLACDGANLPILNNSIDMVFSNLGYESMQEKMMDGFQEAFRILKNGGHTVYTKAAIQHQESENSKKWCTLLLSVLEPVEQAHWKDKLIDINQWLQICEKIGFTNNISTKVYDELNAPDTDIFPFENEIAQWMEEYIITSQKTN